MKRKYAEEISLKKSRLKVERDRIEQVQYILAPILSALDFIETVKPRSLRKMRIELFKGTVVRATACIEHFIRLIIIDSLKYRVFRANVSNLKLVEKLDLQNIILLEDHNIKPGELISHLVKISSFSQILAIFKDLLEVDLVHELKLRSNELFDDNDSIQDFSEHIEKDLIELFKLRNIFAHEISNEIDIDLDFMLPNTSSTLVAFIHLVDIIVEDIFSQQADIEKL